MSEVKWFLQSNTGIVFRIIQVMDDIQDNAYIIRCLTEAKRDKFFMIGEFTDQMKAGKIHKIDSPLNN